MERNVSAQLNCRCFSGVASSPGGTIVPLCHSFGCVASTDAVGMTGKPSFTLFSPNAVVRSMSDISYLLQPVGEGTFVTKCQW